MPVVYPWLAAAVRVLYLAQHSPGYFAVGDLLIVVATVSGLLGVIYGVAWLLSRGRGGRDMPAFITFLAVLGLFGIPAAAPAVPLGSAAARLVVAALVFLATGVVLVRTLWTRRRLLATISLFLLLTTGLLVLRLSASIAVARVHARRQLERSQLARTLAEPIPGPATLPGPARDVYLVVLDEYASNAALRDALGFDNRAFTDSLRALGFVIPRTASNYMHTMLSLPSLLNAAQLEPLAAELGQDEKDPSVPNAILARSRVARFLQQRGYRFVFFPSSWWFSTRTSPLADSVVRVWPELALDRELGRTEFRRVLLQASLLDNLYRAAPWDGEFVRRTLAGVARLPTVPGPVFAFAHVLSPHSPFAFDRSCHTPPRYALGRRRRDQYLDQMQCLNRMVLAMVTRILHDSDMPPIILLQGDHGSGLRGFAVAHDLAQVSPLAARERLGAFGAYYLPAGGDSAFHDSVTVVNVLGNVLRGYFGARLPPAPDDQFMSVEDAPFRFRRAEPRWLESGDGAPPPTTARGKP